MAAAMTPVPRPPPFGVTTIMMCLLFGTNFFIFVLFQIIKYFSKPSENAMTKKVKELSKPFVGTVECFTSMSSELFRTGLIMGMTYACEYLWIFEHSTKSYSRDLFLFILIIFFAYALYTIKPITDLSLLGREQTEEWKGWMQFIFLLYHYFHAEEVYNSVRIMITCYVWMTGFGNFSFFYMKQDFGWLRVVQMLWRLNFSVLLLMWTHGNTYILYYICPLHTFYFLMVYATMYCASSWNHSKWGIRWKLLVVGMIIYLVWDVNQGSFDILFSWLGTDKVIGANSGSVWEFYFRTSLDHWSTLLGMIFALNYPLAEQFFTKAKGYPLIVAAVLMGALTIWWFFYCYSLDKLEYNLSHSYFAIIPLTSYLFFRNITPFVRSGVSMSLHELGKTTLETYLLQHHIWLSSNAKTLWTLIPSHPWINFAVVTLIFFVVSKELYRLTMSLRGMVLPDDRHIAFRNLIGLGVIATVLSAASYLLSTFHVTTLEIIIACEGLAIITIYIINKFSSNLVDNTVYQSYAGRFLKWMAVVFAASLLLQLIAGNSAASSTSTAANINAPLSKVTYRGSSPECLASIAHGKWITQPCAEDSNLNVLPAHKVAFCTKNVWVWEETAGCPIARLSTKKAQAVMKNKQVLFVGDSVVRSAYHQFVSAVEPSYNQNHSYTFKHQDMHFNSLDTVFIFKWAPFIQNITSVLESNKFEKVDLIVAGAGLWDALHIQDLKQYQDSFLSVSKAMSQKGHNETIKVWLLPTDILDDRLPTIEKRLHMNEKEVEKYRQVIRQAVKASKDFHVAIDPHDASNFKESVSMDGVHYAEEIYSVIGQMVLNAYTLHFPKYFSQGKVAKPYVPKTTGSMSNPYLGAGMLGLIVIMLFLMDSFLGIGYIALLSGGRSFDWDVAYTPLHQKIFRSLAPAGEGANSPAREDSNA